MTTEKIEANGNPTTEPEKVTTPSRTSTRSQKASESKQTSALSVKEKAVQSPSGLQLITEPGHLPGNRPIEASHLKIMNTYASVGGIRPIVSSGLEMTGTLTISGQRPIMASHLNISETYVVMGNRPVASNEIDDPEMLMGFLD